MGFWFTMLIVTLFIPILMLSIGFAFKHKSPSKINPLLGYRTSRSMKSIESWKFAHRLCGYIWIFAGAFLFDVTVLTMLLVINKGESAIQTASLVLLYSGIGVIILSIIPVEIALRRTFDENGNRKSPKN